MSYAQGGDNVTFAIFLYIFLSSIDFYKNFSPCISEKRPMFRTPENKKIRKTFFSPHTLWKEAERFERKKTEKQRKSPESRLHAAIVPQYVRFSGLICIWGSADPRPPNFAEIHARGRRGRLGLGHRDLIPPWGHGLLHGEAEKPTMPVWYDRNGSALPSCLTRMVGKDN